VGLLLADGMSQGLELWGAPSFEVGRAGILTYYSRITSTHGIDASQTEIFCWVKGKITPATANQEPRSFRRGGKDGAPNLNIITQE
jgi:hypothetical protein